MKAEEFLKKNCWIVKAHNEQKYVISPNQLQQYADEVSREECIKYLEFVVDYCDEIIYGEQAESYYEAFKEQEDK